MRLRWLGSGLIALALGTALSMTARAETEVSTAAVLGVEALDVPTALTDEISEQLRQRVSASRDLRLVSGKDLVEVKLVFSCADEAASCMAQAGKSLDAQKLIYGSVKKVGDDYAVWLKMFDVRKGKIEFWLIETLPRKDADPAGVKALSARWLAKLTGRPPNAGIVQVTSNVYGANASLDGAPVGATAEQPLVLPDIAPGRHEIALAKPGYVPARQQFLLGAGQTVLVNLSLEMVGTAVASKAARTGATTGVTDWPGAPRDPHPAADADYADNGHDGYRTGFWVTLSAGVISAGAAVKFGLDVNDVNSRLDQYRRFPCAGDANQLCDANGQNPRPPLTQDEKNHVASLNDEGTRAQTLQWICIGIGSALGIASGYLLYKGYIDSGEDHHARQAHRGLRIFPTAGASSGGVLAEFEF